MGTYIKAATKRAAGASSADAFIYNQLSALPENDFSPLEYVPIPSFICKYDSQAQHQLLSCNLPFRTLFNLQEDSSNTVEKLLPISFANSICNRFSDEEVSEKVMRCTENVSLDGVICELDITLSPIYSDLNNIAYISGTINDLTEIEKLPHSSSNRFEHLQTAFNNVPGTIAILNENGDHEFANEEYIQFFNKSYDTLAKINSIELFTSSDKSFREKLQNSLEGDDSAIEVQYLTEEKTWKTILFTISPYLLSDGTIDGVILFGHQNDSSKNIDLSKSSYKHLDQLTKLLDRNSCIAHIDALIKLQKRQPKYWS